MDPTKTGPFSLSKHPVHLGLGATAVVQPQHTGDMAWYAGYGERHGSDGDEGRLLSMHVGDTSWPHWEMHPNGSEVVCVTSGEMTLIQEVDGETTKVHLKAGEFAINPPGVWHTADIDGPVVAVFVTSGRGTDHRPR